MDGEAWGIPAGGYSDKQSARTLARPGLEKLRQAAREGGVPRPYVYRLVDQCRYRLIFPAELEHLASDVGFHVVGVFDNKELEDSDLCGPRLYVAAVHDSGRSGSAEQTIPR